MATAEPHCAQCADYESRVMDRDPDAPVPDDLRPCGAYAMSDRFRAWLVERVGAEVRKDVSASGLDRMALAKGPAAKAAFRHPRARRRPGASAAAGKRA